MWVEKADGGEYVGVARTYQYLSNQGKLEESIYSSLIEEPTTACAIIVRSRFMTVEDNMFLLFLDKYLKNVQINA